MKCLTFSLALDMSTHMSTSYLDIQIQFFYGSTVHNFHLVAVPLFTCHTGEQIYLHAEKILDILCPEWQSIMLSITIGGEMKMTGHISKELLPDLHKLHFQDFSEFGVGYISWILFSSSFTMN